MTNGMLFFLITKLINNHQHNRSVSKETGEEEAVKRMINKILTALAVCLADQYGETVTAAAVEEEKTA